MVQKKTRGKKKKKRRGFVPRKKGKFYLQASQRGPEDTLIADLICSCYKICYNLAVIVMYEGGKLISQRELHKLCSRFCSK